MKLKNKIKIEIEGQPVAKGRPKFRRIGKYVSTYTPKKTLDYQDRVKEVASDIIKEQYEEDIPLQAYIKAYYKIPKSTTKVKRAGMIEETIRPLVKPDLDNIAKIILDSLNNIAYKDDNQIVRLVIEKFYSEEPRVETEITELDLHKDYKKQVLELLDKLNLEEEDYNNIVEIIDKGGNRNGNNT